MSLLLKIAIIFAVTTAMLFLQLHAAPIAAHLGTLQLPYYQGHVQQDSVPDPGFGEYFTKISNNLIELIAYILKLHGDLEPEKAKELKDYVQGLRNFASPGFNFVRKYFPDDTVANNIMNVVNTHLSSLEKLIEEYSVSHKYVKSLAKLMKMLELEAVTS